jgi:uncharacterized membrane protein
VSKKHKGPVSFPVPAPAAQRQAEPRSVSVTASQYRSGPLPDPGEFARYEQILPGSAERLMHQFEVQSEHRRNLESDVVRSNIANERRGMNIGAALAAMFIIGGFAAVMTNHEGAGYAAIGWAAAQISGTYIVALLGKRKQLQPNREPGA